MEANNPYAAPRSDDAGNEPPSEHPLLAEIQRFRPWLSLAGIAVIAGGIAVTVVMIIGLSTATVTGAPLATLAWAIGCGTVAARLFILSRSVREVAKSPRVDRCIRDISKVFAHSGLLIVIFIGLYLCTLLLKGH